MTPRRYLPLLSYITGRIQKNKNLIVVINGQTGSGKTYAGLRILEDLSKSLGTSFTVEGNVDFKFKRLLQKMNKEENCKPGTCFLFEEVGAVGGGAAASQWQTKVNAMFGSFLQTTRSKQRVMIMTCPNFKDLDAKARRLCHLRIEMQNINYAARFSIAKCHIIQTNARTGVDYHKRLRFNHDGRPTTFNRLECDLPSKDILEPYEKMKEEFVNEMEKIIMEGEVKKKRERQEHMHTWRVRITKSDKVCRTCGLIEQITKKNPIIDTHNQDTAIS